MSTTPSGQISAKNVELVLNDGLSTNYPDGTSTLTFNDSLVRTLAGKPVSQTAISMDDMRNKAGPTAYGTLISQYCSGSTLVQTFHDGKYGTYTVNTPGSGLCATGTQYLLVGGGGGGGTGTQDNIGGGGGGGGGGGIYTGTTDLYSGNSLTITIGQGGAGGYYSSAIPGTIGGYYKGGAAYEAAGWIRAEPGESSRISGTTLTAEAGGGKPGLARYYWNGTSNPQWPGSTATAADSVYAGGAGGTGTTGSGNPGGLYRTDGGSDGIRAGGGGGGTDDTNNVWKGGAGASWVDGVTYGGGGGGGGDYSLGGAGGAGGGGQGGSGVDRVSQGTDGLGGGGGGGSSTGGRSWGPGARGGSGRVVIRYAGSSAKATGGTITYSGGYVYHTFTANGTYTMT